MLGQMRARSGTMALPALVMLLFAAVGSAYGCGCGRPDGGPAAGAADEAGRVGQGDEGAQGGQVAHPGQVPEDDRAAIELALPFPADELGTVRELSEERLLVERDGPGGKHYYVVHAEMILSSAQTPTLQGVGRDRAEFVCREAHSGAFADFPYRVVYEYSWEQVGRALTEERLYRDVRAPALDYGGGGTYHDLCGVEVVGSDVVLHFRNNEERRLASPPMAADFVPRTRIHWDAAAGCLVFDLQGTLALPEAMAQVEALSAAALSPPLQGLELVAGPGGNRDADPAAQLRFHLTLPAGYCIEETVGDPRAMSIRLRVGR